MKSKIILAVMLLLLTPISLAQINKTCIDDYTLRVNSTFKVTEDGVTETVSVVKDYDCQYNCTEGFIGDSCGWSPSIKGLFWLLLATTLITIIYVFIWLLRMLTRMM